MKVGRIIDSIIFKKRIYYTSPYDISEKALTFTVDLQNNTISPEGVFDLSVDNGFYTLTRIGDLPRGYRCFNIAYKGYPKIEEEE